MRLFTYNGKLYAETGELVEGVMSCDTVFQINGPTQVRFTMLVEDVPFVPPEIFKRTVLGLEKLQASLSEDV